MAAPNDDATRITQALGLSAEPPGLRVRLRAVGGLLGLHRAGSEALDGLLGPAERARLDAILHLATALATPSTLPSPLESAEAVAAYFGPRLAHAAAERFWVLMLDARGRPAAEVQVAEGTLTACLVHPREVYAPAVRARAASIIAIHNHPSGDPEPSREDEVLTARLAEAGLIIGIPLLDHIVVARGGYRSLGCPHAAGLPQRSRPAARPRKGQRAWKAS